MRTPVRPFCTLLAAAALLAAAVDTTADASAEPPLPATLAQTGLFAAGTREPAPGLLPFAPQYPLWTDGAHKRRWLSLPAGGAIDARDPDRWQFPPGTRVWKEFGFGGRPVETRMIERLPDGRWRFATYAWNPRGSEAVLAPEAGLTVSAPELPGGRYRLPSRADCLACHDGGDDPQGGPLLGLSALQLSPDRDPQALHAEASATSLRTLNEAGLIRGLPPALLDAPPRIAADTPTARAALGYLHGNCGHCHNDSGSLDSLSLSLAQQAAAPQVSAQRTLDSLLGHASRFRAHGSDSTQRVVAGQGEASVLLQRMQSSNPLARMPPLGVQVIDREGVALVERWIREDLGPRSSPAITRQHSGSTP